MVWRALTPYICCADCLRFEPWPQLPNQYHLQNIIVTGFTIKTKLNVIKKPPILLKKNQHSSIRNLLSWKGGLWRVSQRFWITLTVFYGSSSAIHLDSLFHSTYSLFTRPSIVWPLRTAATYEGFGEEMLLLSPFLLSLFRTACTSLCQTTKRFTCSDHPTFLFSCSGWTVYLQSVWTVNVFV